jgi:CBS domain-containing membrane protein
MRSCRVRGLIFRGEVFEMHEFAFARVTSRMRSSFISAAPSDTLLHVAQIMQLARIRHLLVLDANGALVGIVSHRDLLEATAPADAQGSPGERIRSLEGVPISRVMRTRVRSVPPSATLREAAEVILRYGIGCLPVVESGDAPARVVGLLTESDLLAAAYEPSTQPQKGELPRL